MTQNEALIEAIGIADLGRIQEALKNGADINHIDMFLGRTPLIHAIDVGDSIIVGYLIEAGADVNKPSKTGRFPLGAAVWYDRGIADLLLKAKADVNHKGIGDWTALHIAAHQNSVSIIYKLREAGATISRTAEGHSPIEIAAMEGNDEAALALVKFYQHGA